MENICGAARLSFIGRAGHVRAGFTFASRFSLNYRQGNDVDFNNLVNQMNAGQVGALLIYGANPAYDYFDTDKFKTALKKVKLTVSFSEKMDETTELCQYVIPSPHYLESWGDAEPRTGYISSIDAGLIGRASTMIGAGRDTKEDTVDHAVGIILEGKIGQRIEAGRPILTLFARSSSAEDCLEQLRETAGHLDQ